MVQPQRVNRMVFAALTYTGEGSPTLSDRAKQVASSTSGVKSVVDQMTVKTTS